MRHLNIGIAGAGVAGLAAAAGLARNGHRVTLFDQFITPRPVGSGLMIQPVGQSVLDILDCLPAAQAMGAGIMDLHGTIRRHPWAILNVSYDPDQTCGTRGLAMHRSALFQVLMECAMRQGVRLQADHRVSGISDGPQRRLRFENGTESEAFDLVIDALGARSPLTPLTSRPLPYGAIWGTVDFTPDEVFPADQLTQRYQRASHMAGVLPVGQVAGESGQKAAIFWSLRRGDHEAWQDAPLSTWKEEIQALWPEAIAFFDQIRSHDQMTAAFYGHGTLRKWHAPGLIHIGDAAHVTSPQLGQGANMALLDAWALVMALEHTDSLPKALKLVQKLRMRHLRLYQWLSRVFTPMYQSDSRILPFIRDWLLAPPANISFMRRQLSQIASGSLISPLQEGAIT